MFLPGLLLNQGDGKKGGVSLGEEPGALWWMPASAVGLPRDAAQGSLAHSLKVPEPLSELANSEKQRRDTAGYRKGIPPSPAPLSGPSFPGRKEVSRADTVSNCPEVQTFPRPKFKSITSSSLVSTPLSLQTIRGAVLGVCAPTDLVSLPGKLFRGICLRSTAADFNNSPRSVCDSRRFY